MVKAKKVAEKAKSPKVTTKKPIAKKAASPKKEGSAINATEISRVMQTLNPKVKFTSDA